MVRRRGVSLGPLALAAFILLASYGVAVAQGAPPAPAVTVKPVISRQITETGDLIGRVVAIV